MSNTGIIIPERSRDIGSFLVGRLIPFRKKRSVGPFVFVDHMGPSEVGPKDYLDVDQHPHIGLCTLTYLMEGAIQHRDSLGSDQRISPGSVNLMVAGRGVTHTERTPESLRTGEKHILHGYQLWIALPENLSEMEPEFHHLPSEDLPSWEENGVVFRLVAGSAYGRKSPVPTFSPLFMLDVESSIPAGIDLSEQLTGEIGIIVVSGGVMARESRVEAGHILILKPGEVCALDLGENSRILVAGGEAFEQEAYIQWNFVSFDRDRMEQAREDWINQRFPRVPGDETYIPSPGHG